MITLYSMQSSGNCYKPRLAMAQLQIPFKIIETNSVNGDTKKPEFRAMNPNGKVPFMQLADGRPLSESNAMLLFLAEGSYLIPEDRYQRAVMTQWLFFEQYSHEPAIAVRRSIFLYPDYAGDASEERLANLLEKGNQALAVMQTHLETNDWFSGDRYGIADISLFAYTHDAEKGGFDLTAFPKISDWISRVERTDRFADINWQP